MVLAQTTLLFDGTYRFIVEVKDPGFTLAIRKNGGASLVSGPSPQVSVLDDGVKGDLYEVTCSVLPQGGTRFTAERIAFVRSPFRPAWEYGPKPEITNNIFPKDPSWR